MEIGIGIIASIIGVVVLYNVIRLAVWSALRSHAKEQAKA